MSHVFRKCFGIGVEVPDVTVCQLALAAGRRPDWAETGQDFGLADIPVTHAPDLRKSITPQRFDPWLAVLCSLSGRHAVDMHLPGHFHAGRDLAGGVERRV